MIIFLKMLSNIVKPFRYLHKHWCKGHLVRHTEIQEILLKVREMITLMLYLAYAKVDSAITVVSYSKVSESTVIAIGEANTSLKK